MSNFTIPGLMPTTSPIEEATPQYLSLEPHDHTNTNWVGIASLGPITVNGASPDQLAARAILELVPHLYPDRECIVFDSEPGADGTITIEDPETWEFVVPVQPLPLSVGIWNWRFRVVSAEDVSETLYQGQILVR